MKIREFLQELSLVDLVITLRALEDERLTSSCLENKKMQKIVTYLWREN